MRKTKHTPALPERSLRVVICGEVGAGKSSVLNAILRDSLLRPNLGVDSRPVFVVRSGSPVSLRIVHADGRDEQRETVDFPVDLQAITRIEVQTPIPHLAGVDLIEIPFTNAEEISEAHRDLVRSADLLIWVTIASQAWRLTERNIIEALGDCLPANAMVAVSRADKLRSAADRAKIEARLQRETSGWFNQVAFIAASRREIERSGRSMDAWVGTGGAGLMELISTLRRSRPPAKTVATLVMTPSPTVEPITNAPIAVDRPEKGVLVLRQGDLAVSASVPNHPRNYGVSTESLDRLRLVGADLIGATAIGILPTGQAEDCTVIAGEEQTCRRVGLAARIAFDMLSSGFDPAAEAGAVSACVLSMTTCRLIFQEVPSVGLFFLYAENQRMNLGALQAGMARLCRTCLDPSVASAA